MAQPKPFNWERANAYRSMLVPVACVVNPASNIQVIKTSNISENMEHLPVWRVQPFDSDYAQTSLRGHYADRPNKSRFSEVPDGVLLARLGDPWL